MTTRLPLLLLLAICGLALAQPQVPPRGQPLADPSLAEVLEYLDQWGPPTPRSEIGECFFPAHSDAPEVQPLMNEAVCLLHAFSDFESMLVFRHVLRLDQDVPLAYWGLYKCLQWDDGYRRARREALAIAQEKLALREDPRARRYIMAEVSSDTFDEHYEALMEEHPEDLEAVTFWVWSVIARTVNRLGEPLPDRKRMLPMLQRLRELRPEHPATAHMMIHGWEDTLTPEEAMEAVERLGNSSVRIGHIVHMPGHIQHLRANFELSAEAFVKAIEHDVASLERLGGLQNYWNYVHNVAFLVATFAEAGQQREMRSWALDIQSRNPRFQKRQLLDWAPDANRAAGRYFLQGLIAGALGHLRLEDPGAAAESLEQLQLRFRPVYEETANWWVMDYYEALRQYSLGMEALQLVFRHPDSAVCRCPLRSTGHQRAQSDGIMAAAAAQFASAKLTAAQEHLRKLKELVILLEDPMAGETEFGYSVGRRSYLALEIHTQELAALIEFGEDPRRTADKAVAALELAAAAEHQLPYNEPTIYPRPVLLSAADVRTCSCQYGAAEQLYTRVLQAADHKGDGWAWSGLARTQIAQRRPEEARKAYAQLLRFWGSADSTLAPVQEAHRFLSSPQPKPVANGKPIQLTELEILLVVAACLLAGTLGAWLALRCTGRTITTTKQRLETNVQGMRADKVYLYADSFSMVDTDADCEQDLYHVLPQH